MRVTGSVHHSPVEILNPGGRRKWIVYLSDSDPVRLVVFVHGFGGKAIRSWNEFDLSGRIGPWWRESDMLFVGYESLKESPGETAAWIRQRLSDFYPRLPRDILTEGEACARESAIKPYRQLVLVGHSLGGFILRLTLLQEARRWLFENRDREGAASRPPLLDAKLRLFSPASAGFQPAGLLSILTSTLAASMIVLRASPAFKALQHDSDLLARTRGETEALVVRHDGELDALRARIVWARPEHVVERDGYRTDYEAESLIPKRDHLAVCKPRAGYEEPWRFVETGSHGN